MASGRTALAPDAEPLQAMGVPLEDLEVWTALVAPAGLSGAAMQRLSREVPELLHGAEVRSRLLAAGWVAQGTTPEATRRRVDSETRLLGEIIRTQGIKIE